MDKENNTESEIPQKYERKSYKSRRSFYLNKKKNQEIQENKIENPEPKKEEEKITVVKKIRKKEKKPYAHHSYPKLGQKKLYSDEIITNNDLLEIKKYNSSKKIINIETLQNKIITSKNKNTNSHKLNSTKEKEEKLNKSKSTKTMQVKTNTNNITNINKDKNTNDIKNENKITVNTKQNDINNKPKETNQIKIENKNYRINTNKAQNNNSDTKPTNTTTNNPQKSSVKSNPYTKTNVNITSTKTNLTKNVVEVKKNKTQQKMDMLKSQGKSLLLGAPKKECPLCHKYIETHLLKIHMNIHLSQILHWLYLGNFENACDIKELRRNNIGYVLNCAIECKNKVLPKSIVELHLDVRDEPEFDIIKYFDKSNAFINKVRTDGGNILVHCKMGLSRSPSFIIAFLVKYYGFTVDSAINYLKRKRPYVNINHGFIEQLHKYENSFKKKSEK